MVRGYPIMQEFLNDQYSDHLYPMITLSLNTGMRQGEVFSLSWADVDFEKKIITIRGTNAKSKKTRHIPINDKAMEALSLWKKHSNNITPNDYVFPGKNGERLNNVRKAWLKVIDDARIYAFRWHDMRHTFASRLVMGGIDLNTVRELLGHADYQMTLRYAHLAPEHKAAAVSIL